MPRGWGHVHPRDDDGKSTSVETKARRRSDTNCDTRGPQCCRLLVLRELRGILSPPLRVSAHGSDARSRSLSPLPAYDTPTPDHPIRRHSLLAFPCFPCRTTFPLFPLFTVSLSRSNLPILLPPPSPPFSPLSVPSRSVPFRSVATTPISRP